MRALCSYLNRIWVFLRWCIYWKFVLKFGRRTAIADDVYVYVAPSSSSVANLLLSLIPDEKSLLLLLLLLLCFSDVVVFIFFRTVPICVVRFGAPPSSHRVASARLFSLSNDRPLLFTHSNACVRKFESFGFFVAGAARRSTQNENAICLHCVISINKSAAVIHTAHIK